MVLTLSSLSIVLPKPRLRRMFFSLNGSGWIWDLAGWDLAGGQLCPLYSG